MTRRSDYQSLSTTRNAEKNTHLVVMESRNRVRDTDLDVEIGSRWSDEIRLIFSHLIKIRFRLVPLKRKRVWQIWRFFKMVCFLRLVFWAFCFERFVFECFAFERCFCPFCFSLFFKEMGVFLGEGRGVFFWVRFVLGALFWALFFWTSFVERLLLSVFCWASFVERLCVLGALFWAFCFERLVLGAFLLNVFCWASFVERLLLSVFFWASVYWAWGVFFCSFEGVLFEGSFWGCSVWGCSVWGCSVWGCPFSMFYLTSFGKVFWKVFEGFWRFCRFWKFWG